jgi:hypothetical protein
VTGWRGWALAAGATIVLGGLAVWTAGGGPWVALFGALMMLTAALEPIYGRANGRPTGSAWQPTDERFVDPESGDLVTVWYDPATGERRYVADETPPRP